MDSLPLHPEALEDLRRSGLSDATIATAGLHTAAPGNLPRLLSPRLLDQVRHVLIRNPCRADATAEPFFLLFNADVEFLPTLTPDDLQKAGLDELGRKWK